MSGDHHCHFGPVIIQLSPSTDVDECSLGTSGCEKLCNNTQGSYTCSCPAGYTLFEGEDATLVANHSCVCKLAGFLMIICQYMLLMYLLFETLHLVKGVLDNDYFCHICNVCELLPNI